MAGSRHSIYIDLIADATGLRRGLDNAGRDLDGFASRSLPAKAGLVALGIAGAAAGTLLAKGLMVAGAEAIKFDAAMANVNSIAGMSAGELRATGDQLVNLSKTLPQSATTLAQGLYDVASSGFQGADGMTVLTAAAVSASAGLSTTAVAAKSITAVLNAYHLPAAQAADVSDTLFSTVKLGVITFEQLSHSVGEYLGTAQALGVSFPETGAAIATMTLNGIAAAQSGTALNAVLAKLIVPSTKLAPLLKAAGYESGTAAIKALGLAGTMDLIAKATGGSAEAMQAMFPDVQALQGALALTSNQGRIYNEVTGKIVDPTQRAGVAAAALAEQAKGAGYQLTLLRNSAMSVGLNVGRSLMPYLAQAAGALAGLTVEGSASRQALAPLAGIFEAIGSAGGHLWQAITDIGTAYGGLILNVGGVALTVLGAALTVVAQAANGVAAGLEMLTGMFAAHSTTAIALAITVGILSGAFASLAIAVLAPIGTAITLGYVALSSLVLNVAASIGAMSAAAIIGTAGIAALVLALSVLVVKGFQATAEGADRVRAATQQMFAGIAAGSQAYIDATNRARDYATAQTDAVKGMSNWSALTGLFSGRFWELKSAQDAANKSSAEHAAIAGRAGDVIARVGAQYGIASASVLKLAALNNIDLGAQNVDATAQAMGRLVEQAAATGLGVGVVSTALAGMAAPAAQSKEAIAAATEQIKVFGDALVGFVVPIDAYKGLLDGKQAKENEAAQSAATANGQTGVSWQGLVVTARVSVAEYLAELEKMVVAQRDWQANMTLLSAKVSADTLAELGKLGPQGAPLVAQLVTASDAELARLETAFAARSKNATDAAAAQLIAANPVLREIAGRLGQDTANSLAAQLNAGTITVAQIMARYGATIVNGLTPFLASIGITPSGNFGAFLSQFSVPGRAEGGLLRGPGGPKGDKILGLDKNSGLPMAWVSDREYVVNAAATAANLPLLQAINAGHLADGGYVVPRPPSTAPFGPPISTLADRAMSIEYQAASARLAQSMAAASGPTPTGGSVTRWTDLVSSTLTELGLSQGLIPKVLRQIETESGGNPKATQGAINDVNNRSGDLARGLMQVIGATFRAYAGPYIGLGQYDPHASVYAGLNYARNRYGPDLRGLGEGHGYATGGLVSRPGSAGRPHNRDRGGPLLPGYTYNGTGRSELVVPDRAGSSRAEPGGRADRRIQVDNITMVNSRATAPELARTLAWL